MSQAQVEINRVTHRTLEKPGMVEFCLHVTGLLAKAEIIYGDQATERLNLTTPVADPTLYAEHTFQPGQYDVVFRVYDRKGLMQRHILNWVCP